MREQRQHDGDKLRITQLYIFKTTKLTFSHVFPQKQVQQGQVKQVQATEPNPSKSKGNRVL
jgi:hypothetical protein